MVYETFLEAVRHAVQEKLEPGVVVTLRRILQNNGVVLDGLSFNVPGIPFSPTVYLNSYYEELKEGVSLPVIASQILLLYEEEQLPDGLEKKLSDLSVLRDQVVYKLIGTADNEALLADVPHFRYLDLALVFYVIVSEDPLGQMTALIHNEHLKLWNITKEKLFCLAEKNTPSLLPPRIRPIEDVILGDGNDSGGFSGEAGSETLPPVNLFVLTNVSGINGAACLLYPNILKDFADAREDDLIILPSSIHEVLLAPAAKALSYEELNDMVVFINRTDVPPEDRLSDHVYRYCRDQNCLLIPASFSGSGGRWNPQ